MFDIGVGIAIAGVAVAAAPVAITALRVKSANNGKADYLTEEHHDQICKLKQANIDVRFDNIKDDLDEIKADVKLLLQRGDM